MESDPRPGCCLLVWGANSYGQLGRGDEEDQPLPRLADTAALQDRTVRCLDGGGGHTVLVAGSGEVFVCGQNNRGQLGLGHTANIPTLQPCRCLKHRVAGVSCGWDFTLLLTDSGKVLACGSNAFGQLGVGEAVSHSAELMVVESLEEPVQSVAAGLRHSLASTASGQVYQWGTGLLRLAQKALGPQPVPQHLGSKVPALVPGLDKTPSRVVAAGSAHCACLTDGGDLFLWGSNKRGQLPAAGPYAASPLALERSLLGGERVKNVWSGWTHLVVQTESGRVLTWGRGDYGQLGRTAERRPNLPAEVRTLRGATQVACGSEHNLAVVGGAVLAWGWNEHGMCGDGSLTDAAEPLALPGLKPLLVACGAGHSVAVCEDK